MVRLLVVDHDRIRTRDDQPRIGRIIFEAYLAGAVDIDRARADRPIIVDLGEVALGVAKLVQIVLAVRHLPIGQG